MRSVLSISLPKKMADNVKEVALDRGFNSVSEYAKSLFMEDSDLISVGEVLKASSQADKEYECGSLRKINKLSDLL